jgi:hypothetical protein
VNRLNLLAWANLGIRTLTNFGLLLIVGRLSGAEGAETWLLIVTLVATLATLDALLGQYFVRAFIDSGDSSRITGPVDLQDSLYWLLGLVFLAAGLLFLDGLAWNVRLMAAVLLGSLATVRRLEARTRAVADLEHLQLAEVVGSLVVLLACLLAATTTRSAPAVTITFLAILTVNVIAKNRLLARTRPFLGVGLRRNRLRSEILQLGRLGSATVVSSGGALSANVGLLLMSKVLSSATAGPLLLSFRIAMLVCEFGSAPVVARIPAYSREVVQRGIESSRRLFRPDFTTAILLTALGLLTVAGVGPYLLSRISDNVRLVSTACLSLIGLTWIIERHNTLRSQFLMCAQVYRHYKIYMLYIVLTVAGTLSAMVLESATAFIGVHLLTNIVIGPQILRVYRHPVDSGVRPKP